MLGIAKHILWVIVLTGSAIACAQSIAAGPTTTAPAAGVPDAAELVRQVRAGEAWLHQAVTLDVEFTTTLTKSNSPEVEADQCRVAFDREHMLYLYYRVAGDPPYYARNVWDGLRCTSLFCVTNAKGFSCHIEQMQNANVNKPWAIEQRRAWLQKQDDPETIFGKPEEYGVEGRTVFHGVDCHVVQRVWMIFAQRLYIGVADGRAYGAGLYVPDDSDGTESIDAIREEAARQGRVLSSTEEALQWFFKQPQPVKTKLYREMWQGSMHSQGERWFSDYQQLGPGRWAPMKSGSRAGDGRICETKITRLVVDEPVDAKLFELQIPEGTQVRDFTHKPPLEYVYKAKAATTEPK